MSEIRVLLYRNWLEFKRKYISYILLWFSLPMIIYLFMVIPLSFQISKVDLMNYRNWVSPGIWICSSAILSFIYSKIKLRNLIYKNNYINKYLKAPISNGQLLSSLLFSSFIMGLIQLVISIVITTSLNNDNLNFIQLILILINSTSILVFFAILGLLCAIYAKEDLVSIFMFLFVLIILFFSIGTLIPLSNSYNKFLVLASNLPIYQIVLNVQLLYAGKIAMIYPVVIMNVINVIMFIIVLIMSYKKFRD